MNLVATVDSYSKGRQFTARTLLEFIRRSNPIWWNPNKMGIDCPWVFRGHRDARWKLVPKAARPLAINELRPIAEELSKLPEQSSDNLNDTVPGNIKKRLLLVEAQRLVFRRFIQLGHEL